MPDDQEALLVQNQEMTETKTITISEDYLAFLHDVLSENQIRLKEILGESEAGAVFSWCADRLVRTVRPSRYASSPIEGVVRRLTSWGMVVTWKEEGNLTKIEVKCPYAEQVHPRLSSKGSSCPLGEYLLGAVRLEDSKAQLLHNTLTEEGVKFALKATRRVD
jgi:hypothetical protein